MEVKLNLTGDLERWAREQADPVSSILEILEANVGRTLTPLDHVSNILRDNLKSLPSTMEFEIPQVVGFKDWEVLDRTTRLTFGKHVRANAEAFGLVFVRKTASNHAIYRKA
ncbi:hypothetical protein [Paraburkholderia sp. MM5482-R1]|uniref:hypothetical protein n=1 Tax=unclassified Paraburkholderia TaxID=2615204 RepID=UPI003D201009